MERWQQEYYTEMVHRNRAFLFYGNNKLLGVVTFFVGDNDEKYLDRDPWTVVLDNPYGETLYVDQLITVGGQHKAVRREFRRSIDNWVHMFPNVKQIKWARAKAAFRKKGESKGERYVMVRKLI